MTEQQAITTMFDDIAPRYDLLNRLLSFRMDTLWRRRLSRMLSESRPQSILDAATGTGDLAIRVAKDLPTAHVTGIDLSEAMLEIGREKTHRQHLSDRIKLLQADAQQLPFADQSFDAVTVAFGVRNFEKLNEGLAELHRVVKKGGSIGILEFSMPDRFPIKPLYRLYSKHLIPFVGRVLSKHPSAYTYLPESIEAFNHDNDLVAMMKSQGLNPVRTLRLSGGIATIYYGKA